MVARAGDVANFKILTILALSYVMGLNPQRIHHFNMFKYSSFNISHLLCFLPSSGTFVWPFWPDLFIDFIC